MGLPAVLFPLPGKVPRAILLPSLFPPHSFPLSPHYLPPPLRALHFLPVAELNPVSSFPNLRFIASSSDIQPRLSGNPSSKVWVPGP